MKSSTTQPNKNIFDVFRSWNYAEALQQYLVLSSLCQSRECLVQSRGKDHGSYRRRLWYLRWQIIKYYSKNIFNFPIILLKLLTPSFFRGDPNIWVNLKSLATRAEFHPLRMAVLSWFVFTYVMFQGGLYFIRHAAPALAASYTWTQTAWTASTTNTGVHPTNQTGLVDYYSVDSYITTGTSLSMAGLASSITHDETADFADGTYSNTVAGGGGVSMITLGRSAASFSETSVDAALTSASGADDVDVDNDGDMDLVGSAYAFGSNQLVKYTNNGSQSFTKANLATLTLATKVIGLDVESDGDDDFVSAGEISTISLYRNNGSGTFTATTMKTLDDGYFVDFEVADLDDDGDYDLIGSQDVYQDKLYWVRNTNFSFSSEIIIDETNIGGVNGMVIHDIDDDGDKDIAIAATTVGDVIWYSNNGSESFTKTTIDASLASASQVVAGDFDGDTDEDIAAIGGATLVWYANNGSESFTKTSIDTGLTSSVDLVASDVDADGDIDLIGGGSGGLVKWYVNNGSGSFTATTLDSNFTVGQLSLGDVNSDGATDIIAAGGSSVAWYRQVTAYVASGSYTSEILDTLENSAYNTVSWSASSSLPTTLAVKVRTSNSASMSGATAFSSCTAITSGVDISSNGCVTDGHRYIQYQLNFTTASESVTPQFNSIVINYSPPVQSLVSAPYNTADASNVLNKIQWTESIQAGTDIKFQIRTAPDSSGSPGTWTSWLGPSGTGDYYTDPTGGETVNSTNGDGVDDQWVQYRVFLSTTDAGYAPTLSDVSLTYVVNAPPEFQSMSALQNSDGTVSIDYAVRDPDTTTGSTIPGFVTPSFQYSTNNGSSWTTVTGGLSAAATTTKAVQESAYTSYSLTWDGRQIDGTYVAQAKIRVTVNDGEAANSTASSTSAAFTIDLKDPVPGSPAVIVIATTTPAQLRISASDDSALEMKVSLNADLSGASWQTYSTASSVALLTDPDTVYVQFRDAYGNTSATQSASTPETPASLIIRDVSNEDSDEYQLFIAWRVVGTPLVDFSRYEIWTSTNGSTYTLLENQDSRSLNYVVQFNLTQGATYYYKIATVDTDGNASYFSSAVSDSANGQGGTDVTAPTISNIVATPLSQSATITWDTDELSDSTISYSTSEGTFTNSTGVTSMVDTSGGVGRHSVTLTGLTPGTAYYYRVTSVDPTGNSASDTDGGTGHVLTTISGPTISSVAVQDTDSDSATVTWNTTAAGDTKVYYSTNADMSGATLISNASSVTEHRIGLTGLSAGTRYYFYVGTDTSTDNNGGSYYSFTTPTDGTGPIISSVTANPVYDTVAIITWTTNELATSQVEVDTASTTFSSSTLVNANLNTNHSVRLGGLTTETIYYYRVISIDGSGNTTTSTIETFTTLEELSEESEVAAREAAAQAAGTTAEAERRGSSGSNSAQAPTLDTIPPTILRFGIDTFATNTVTIAWKTDEAGDSVVQFGESTGYGNLAGAFESATEHAVVLRGLRANTAYHYRVTTADSKGNRALSSDAIFTTLPDTEQIADETSEEEKNTEEKAEEEKQKEEDEKAEDTELLTAAVGRALEIVNRMASQVSIPLSVEESLVDSLRELAKTIPPPLLSGRPSIDIGSEYVTIAWNTDKEANSMVAFASDEDFVKNGGYTQIVGDPESFVLDHSVTILGLNPSTKYHYQIRSRTPASGVSESSDFIFTTRDEESQIETYTVEVISPTDANFAWDTNVPTDTQLLITPYRDGIPVSAETRLVEDKDMTKSHEMRVTDLEAGVTYDVELSGKDVGGNTVSKIIRGFVTDDTNSAPIITQVQTDSAISPGQDGNIQTVISWVTNEPSTSRIFYQKGFSADSELKEKTPLDQGYVKKHVVVVTSFEPGAVYQFRAESIDASGNPGYSKNFTILTPRQKESVFQVIFRNAEDAFGWVKVFQGQ